MGRVDPLHRTDLAEYVEERLQGSAVAAYAAALIVGDRTSVAAGGKLSSAAAERADSTTPFHICSCSKAFTALTLATLVDRGLTSWDAPVAVIVPEFLLSDPWVSQHMTLRDLAGMRVGLDRKGIAEWGFRPGAALEERLGRARFMAFDAPFRDRFSYSNLCYIALALAAARIYGKRFEDCLKELVFEPLGLAAAALQPTARAAAPHMPIAGRMTAVPELTGDSSHGSARVYLSADDAARWIAAMLQAAGEATRGESTGGAQLFVCQSLVRLRTRSTELPSSWGYGFGWSLAEYRGRQVFSHGGGGRGWRAFMILDPGLGAGAMVMLAHEGNEAEALAVELLELAAGRAPQRRAALDNPAPESPGSIAMAEGKSRHAGLGKFAGLYRGEVTGYVRIAESAGGNLHFAPEDAPAFEALLEPLQDGEFTPRFNSPAMTRMPADPPFTIRFTGSGTDMSAVSDYFGALRRVEQ